MISATGLRAQVGIALAFTAELYGWVCLGEIAGRGGTLVGYSVK
jgi:hypothetical protein